MSNAPTKTQKQARSSARLHAVMALYQNEYMDMSASDLMLEYKTFRIGNYDGMDLPKPDAGRLTHILKTAEDEYQVISDLVQNNLNDRDFCQFEIILRSILVAGTAELFYAPDEAAIIINDFIDIAKAYCGDNEAKLVNAVLDGVAKTINAS